MRLAELHLKAYGPFTDQVLHLGTGTQRLVIVHGLNEAGKSSALRAIAALRFGVPSRTADRFVHDYAQMRIGGVFVDADGQRHALLRRKGTGVTLKFADLASGTELPQPVPPELLRQLTGGLPEADYHAMYGLDHATLREGGEALAAGRGEIGAALFEASAGVGDVTRALTELDATARSFYTAAANARAPRVNQALATYRAEADRHRDALVKPSQWEGLARAAQAAADALGTAQQAFDQASTEHARVRELIAVGPLLASLTHAQQVQAELAASPLLAENAPAERAMAQAGLSEAVADRASHEAALAGQQALLQGLAPDPLVLAVGPAIARLHAATAAIGQLRAQQAAAEAERAARLHERDQLAAALDATMTADALRSQLPGAAAQARLVEAMAALDEATRALAQHRRDAPDMAAEPHSAPRDVPAPSLQAALRVALADVARQADVLRTASRLPRDIAAAERDAAQQLAGIGLTDETAARAVRPLLTAVIDEAQRSGASLDAERADRQRRLDEIDEAQAVQQRAIDDLLAHGPVPTHDDVRAARGARDHTWLEVRTHLQPGAPPVPAGLPAALEHAVAHADALVDQLARDTGRVASLEAARRQLASLARDRAAREAEQVSLDARQAAADAAWSAQLAHARMPALPPAAARGWLERLGHALAACDTLQRHRDELDDARAVETALTARLQDALHALQVHQPEPHTGTAQPLATLQALAEHELTQIEQLTAARNHAAGQAEAMRRRVEAHAALDQRRAADLATARRVFEAELPALRLDASATMAVARARLAEFERLAASCAACDAAAQRVDSLRAALQAHQQDADAVALALDEPPPADLLLAADRWAARHHLARDQQAASALALQRQQAARDAMQADDAKALRHQAALERLCGEAGVRTVADLPLAEERSQRKRQALRDAAEAARLLAAASRRSVDDLHRLIGGREPEALHADEQRLEHRLATLGAALAQARATEEQARRARDDIDASDSAAAAAEAMARAAATVRHTLPLQFRTRLAHALLQEGVRRFKERSQGPMLASASRHFTRITGGQFDGLLHDDSDAVPVIVARRRAGGTLGVPAMSEGTRDQLYLALRLAALDLQRARGVELPVVLDDVLMTSDDQRAAHTLQALAAFAQPGGQVIVFTHHTHLCDIARAHVPPEQLAIVALQPV